MDPLSIASGVAGLVGLAIQIAPSLHAFFQDVKDAKADVDRYVSEVISLHEVCQQLHVFLKTDAAARDGQFETTQSVLSRTVLSCDECLRELAHMLKSPTGWSRKMKWPIYKKRVEAVIQRLGRYTQVFQFSLTLEGCAVLSRTPEDVTTILKLQVDASSKLHDITAGISSLKASSESYRNTAEEMSAILESIQSFTGSTERLVEIQESVNSITRQLTDKHDMKILDWLSPERGRMRHHEVRSRRTPGTGKWVLNTSFFQDWINPESPQRFLWLVGAPGCGKSTLLYGPLSLVYVESGECLDLSLYSSTSATTVSLVIDELKLSHTGIAYYYCDYRVQSTNPLTLILGSLLRLFVEQQLGGLPQSLRDLFETSNNESRPPSPSEIESIMRTLTASLPRCFILVDAIDEFSVEDTRQTAQLTRLLDTLAEGGVYVFVTSRTAPTPSLKSSHLVIQHTADEADIKSYVAHTLQDDDSMIDILDTQLQRHISEAIVQHAKGMFLLAVLHLRTIRGQVTRSGVRKALSELSGDLGEAYDKTFEAIQHQSLARQQLALDTIMWVSFSHRPLSSIELQHALATKLDDEDFDEENIPPLQLIIHSCCGLIAVDDSKNEHSHVRLVHHTLHQYLQTRQWTWLSNSHSTITNSCLRYLLFKALLIRVPETPKTRKSASSTSRDSHGLHGNDQSKCREKLVVRINERLILTSFALEYWGQHASKCQPEAYSQLALRLSMDSERLKALYPNNEKISGLHIASGFGLGYLVSALIKQGIHVDSIDSNAASALHVACELNNTEIALLLLQHGANANRWNFGWTSPLFLAVENNNFRLTKSMLDHGAKPGICCKDRWTPLQMAADRGFIDLVKLLLDAGSSTMETSVRGLSALHRAAGRGHLDVIRLLLEHNSRVDCETQDRWTPLHGAASSGQTEAVKLLIANGADIRRQGSDAKTPLHRACQGGHTDTVEQLIACGADVMVEDYKGDLPLHIASREGYVAIIDCLLKRGPRQLSHLNREGLSPLHEAQLSGFHAAEKRLRQLAQLLGLNTSGDEPEDDVARAIKTDDVNKIKHLLGPREKSQSIDINAHDTLGRTLLHQALHAESYRVATILLEEGADIHARSGTGGWQPIHYAALSGNVNAVQLCLKHGAAVNALTHSKQTPLHHACRHGSVETVQLLLNNFGDVELGDKDKMTPLHTAAAAGHEKIVELLIENGADPNAETAGRLSVQSCAALRGHHSLVEMLRNYRYSLV